MPFRLDRRLCDPLFLLCLTAGLLAFVVQSGELGTSDTTHRLQTTHWLWTSEPQVFPNEYPEFGLHGRGGRLYSWYGIGQSLLMLPADLAGTAIAHLPIFADYTDDPSVRSIVVSYSTDILVNVLTALIAFRFFASCAFQRTNPSPACWRCSSAPLICITRRTWRRTTTSCCLRWPDSRSNMSGCGRQPARALYRLGGARA